MIRNYCKSYFFICVQKHVYKMFIILLKNSNPFHHTFSKLYFNCCHQTLVYWRKFGGKLPKLWKIRNAITTLSAKVSSKEDFSGSTVVYTLLKSNVTSRDHMVRSRGSQECGSRYVNFACQFHWRWHRIRITLKSTTLLFMRSSNVWTTKPWQWS